MAAFGGVEESSTEDGELSDDDELSDEDATVARAQAFKRAADAAKTRWNHEAFSDDETLDDLVQGACPVGSSSSSGAVSWFQGASRLPDNVVMMILRRADYDLNVLRTCKDLSRLGTAQFADYWLGRIIHAEETTLNHEAAPNKVSKRWARADSVKVQTDGRSAATRRVVATEFLLQRLVSSAAKRLNVHRILEIVAHGITTSEATGRQSEMYQAVMRACSDPTSALHASMLTRFPYIVDVAYRRVRKPSDAFEGALIGETAEERRAARAALRPERDVRCNVHARQWEEFASRLAGVRRDTARPPDDRVWELLRRTYGVDEVTMREKWLVHIAAAREVIGRLRPHVEAAVRRETIFGRPVYTEQADVDAAVANVGLGWGSYYTHLAPNMRPSQRDEMRMFLMRYMDPVTRPWVVRAVGPVSFWHISGLRSAGDLFNPLSYPNTYDADADVRRYFAETGPCGGLRYFRLAILAGTEPNEQAQRNLGGFSSGLYWDTSLLESLAGTFSNGAFAGPIGHWNVSRVTTMRRTFENNTAFDPSTILQWNVQRVRHGDVPSVLVRAPR
jgi:hypothetical protein